jgi:acyl dehydratase
MSNPDHLLLSMPESIDTPLIRVGESFHSELRYSREQIEQFARLSGDANPLHFDRQAAERANFGEIIASGQQTASHMMGLVASHLSRRSDGVPREMLCLNFNFAFKAPVFAEQLISIHWRVSVVESCQRRGGFIGHVDGRASVAGTACVIGRGTVLVTRAAAAVMA